MRPGRVLYGVVPGAVVDGVVPLGCVVDGVVPPRVAARATLSTDRERRRDDGEQE